MRDEDKNNMTCLQCNERLRYVHSLGRSLGDPSAAAEENCILPQRANGRALAC